MNWQMLSKKQQKTNLDLLDNLYSEKNHATNSLCNSDLRDDTPRGTKSTRLSARTRTQRAVHQANGNVSKKISSKSARLSSKDIKVCSRSKSSSLSEAQHQIRLVREIYKYPPIYEVLFHIPNGGKRNGKEGGKFKHMGVKRGVPDLFVGLARKSYHGLFLELKKPGGQLSIEQKVMIERLRAQNYAVEVAEGWELGVEIVLRYCL